MVDEAAARTIAMPTMPKPGPDLTEGFRKVVGQISRDQVPHSRDQEVVKRDDRTAIVALLVEMHRRRTNGGSWTSKDQLMAEYAMVWADDL